MPIKEICLGYLFQIWPTFSVSRIYIYLPLLYLLYRFKNFTMNSTTAGNSTFCGFEGNSDVYGIGIRIGYYTQALAAWFANYFFLKDAKVLQVTNTLFLLALGIAIIVYSRDPSQIYAVEVFSLGQIEAAILISATGSSSRYSSRYFQKSWPKKIAYETLVSAILMYGIYYWYYGMDLMQKTPCGTYVAYFARADLFGPLRIFMKVTFVLALLKQMITVWPKVSSLFLMHLMLERKRSAFISDTVKYKSQNKARIGNSASQASIPLLPRANALKANSLYPTFTAIQEACHYLDEIFPPATKKQTSRKGHHTSLSTFFQNLILRLKFHSRFNPRHTILFSHFDRLKLNVYGDVKVIHRIEARNRQGPCPSWKWISIASDIRQAQLPLHASSLWVSAAVQRFLLIVFLVIQVEFAIVWNQIYGLNGLATVGQLVPLVIGIVGLVSVLFNKARQLRDGQQEDRYKLEKEDDRYTLAIEAYLQWLATQEAVGPVQGINLQPQGA
jgi:hypothetical protein